MQSPSFPWRIRRNDSRPRLLAARASARRPAELEAQAEAPIRLPSPDELLSKLAELRENLEEDPLEGREALRRFIDGEIRLDLGEDGIFTARTRVLPLVLLGARTPNDRSSGGDRAEYPETRLRLHALIPKLVAG